jgi:hypothetical protein
LIILVDGEGGSGKMVLRSLLDGHPELIVSPIHDKIIDGLSDHPASDRWLEHKDTTYLRELLARTSYYDLEKYSLAGFMEFELAATEGLIRIPTPLDFAECDGSWMARLNQLEHWTRPIAVTEILSAVHRCWKGSRWPDAVRGYVGVGFDNPRARGTFFEHYPDARLLYLSRPVFDIIASRLGRKPIAGDTRSDTLKTVNAETYVLNGKAARIRARLGAVQSWAERWPEKVMIVPMEELVSEPGLVMTQVATFLGIAFDDVLTRPTVFGHELRSASGASYIGRVLDRPSALLSAADRRLLSAETGATPLLTLARTQPKVTIRLTGLRTRRSARAARQRLARLIAR